MADLLASGVNMNVGGWRLAPSATEIELALTRFFAHEMFGLPSSAGGLIVSGGAMANFVGLKAARDHRAGWDIRNDGILAGPQLGLYLSTETHVVSDRAADMLGIGWGNVRHVAVDDDFRMRVDELREQIVRDRRDGIRPFAVVGSAGTVSTGAIDPLEQIAVVCAEEGLWFHVDGAYGGPAMLADDLRPQFAGIERADSIAFDPHKWLYTPHSGACLLLRDFAQLKESFDADPSYIHQDKDLTHAGVDLGRVRAAVQPELLGAEDVGIAARARRRALRGAASRTMPSWPGTWPRVSRGTRRSSSRVRSRCRSAASASFRRTCPRDPDARRT